MYLVLQFPLPSSSTWGVTRQIIREEGVQGLFRGLTSTWAREVPGYFFFFGGYDASRKLLTPKGQSHEDLSRLSYVMSWYSWVTVILSWHSVIGIEMCRLLETGFGWWISWVLFLDISVPKWCSQIKNSGLLEVMDILIAEWVTRQLMMQQGVWNNGVKN